jgi:hypothetical protein
VDDREIKKIRRGRKKLTIGLRSSWRTLDQVLAFYREPVTSLLAFLLTTQLLEQGRWASLLSFSVRL